MDREMEQAETVLVVILGRSVDHLQLGKQGWQKPSEAMEQEREQTEQMLVGTDLEKVEMRQLSVGHQVTDLEGNPLRQEEPEKGKAVMEICSVVKVLVREDLVKRSKGLAHRCSEI
jgi:hypothetical protein